MKTRRLLGLLVLLGFTGVAATADFAPPWVFSGLCSFEENCEECRLCCSQKNTECYLWCLLEYGSDPIQCTACYDLCHDEYWSCANVMCVNQHGWEECFPDPFEPIE
jgi:hypothetical protein